jgi:hypothetical protein
MTEGTMIRLGFAAALLAAMAGSALAQRAAPGGGGSLPLTDVLEVAKPYPNLLTQTRVWLLAAGLKKEQVSCSGDRYSNAWIGLGGRRVAPYVCPIGKRTLTVTATPVYYDRNGYRLNASDPQLQAKAMRVAETRLKWTWK